MLENLLSALEITLIGMGLVFAAIILLWGVMVVLIRIGEERKIPSKQSPSQDEKINQSATGIIARKRRAAAATVAYALAQNRYVPREFPLPPTAIVSAWQAVARSNMLKRGRVR
jgi:Na+-transporting methylmalonyl-CoA/oxaloacetate decarboxylase gamma subunit